jgi:hypothetical protein
MWCAITLAEVDKSCFLQEKQHAVMNIWIRSFPELDGVANVIFKQGVLYIQSFLVLCGKH